MRKVVGDTFSYVFDTSYKVQHRVRVMDELIGWLYTYFDAKDNENARLMLAWWGHLMGRFWYGSTLMLLETREGARYGEYSPGDVKTMRTISRRFAELYVFPCGRVITSVAFDQRMYVSEFTALVQSMAAPSASPTPPAPPVEKDNVVTA